MDIEEQILWIKTKRNSIKNHLGLKFNTATAHRFSKKIPLSITNQVHDLLN